MKMGCKMLEWISWLRLATDTLLPEPGHPGHYDLGGDLLYSGHTIPLTSPMGN